VQRVVWRAQNRSSLHPGATPGTKPAWFSQPSQQFRENLFVGEQRRRPQLLTEPGRCSTTVMTTPGRLGKAPARAKSAPPPTTTKPVAMRRRDAGKGSGACRWLGRRETLSERGDQDGGRCNLHGRDLPHYRGEEGSACGPQVAGAGHSHAHTNPQPTPKPTARSSTGKNATKPTARRD